MSALPLEVHLLLQAGRLLLEYNESTRAIHRALLSTARTLTDAPCHVEVTYRGVAVELAGYGLAMEPIRELHYNTAVQARVHQVLELVREGELDAQAALAILEVVEAETPRHARSLVAATLAAAAASLAALLGADVGAIAAAGVSTGLGSLARQQLGRRHVSLLALPFVAALIGAIVGGVTIRLGWTYSPELVLIVPALMLVPGPHLINGLFDLIDNFVPMSLYRLGLALGILLASALGIVIGVELTRLDAVFLEQGGAHGLHLNVFSDMFLAGIVTCGFGLFYNTKWQHLWMAMFGGMVGHGLRFLALELGFHLEAATFLGGMAVGVVSALMTRYRKTPVAVISFAGAVTMIPGLSIYRGLSGALQLARQPNVTDAATVAATLGYAFQGFFVVVALGLGLVIGARAVLALTASNTSASTLAGGCGLNNRR